MNPQTSHLFPWFMAALVGWMLYRRVRRSFGMQPWRPKTTAIRLGFMALIALMLALATFAAPHAALPMLGAALAGAALGAFALRHTHAHWEGDQRVYHPNPWISAVLMVVLVGRLAWRFTQGGGMVAAQQKPSALTLAVAAALVMYQLVYAAGLILRMRALGEAPPEPPVIPVPPRGSPEIT